MYYFVPKVYMYYKITLINHSIFSVKFILTIHEMIPI